MEAATAQHHLVLPSALRRLARNRASARLRRLKKKTAINTLQKEVRDLQSEIARMRALKDEVRLPIICSPVNSAAACCLPEPAVVACHACSGHSPVPSHFGFSAVTRRVVTLCQSMSLAVCGLYLTHFADNEGVLWTQGDTAAAVDGHRATV